MKYLEKETEFYNIINGELVLVDFYTEWCGPCKMLSPVLEEIDFVKVLKVDADKFPNLSMKYGIMSVPTLCFFKNNELVRREIGFKNLDEIKKIYEELIG